MKFTLDELLSWMRRRNDNRHKSKELAELSKKELIQFKKEKIIKNKEETIMRKLPKMNKDKYEIKKMQEMKK